MDSVLFFPETVVVNKTSGSTQSEKKITKVTTGLSVLVFEFAGATIRDAEIITEPSGSPGS